MRYFVLHGAYQSRTARHPGPIAIRDALRAFNEWWGVPGGGHLYNTLPRIVRWGGMGNGWTHVAVLWEFPDQSDRSVNLVMPILKRNIDERMVRLSGYDWTDEWSGTESIAYNARVHGPLTWWQGEHAVTRTTDEFPGLSTDPRENPVGPTSSETHPGGVLQSAGDASWTDQAKSLLKVASWFLGIGTAGAVVVYGGPVVSSWLKRRP